MSAFLKGPFLGAADGGMWEHVHTVTVEDMSPDDQPRYVTVGETLAEGDYLVIMRNASTTGLYGAVPDLQMLDDGGTVNLNSGVWGRYSDGSNVSVADEAASGARINGQCDDGYSGGCGLFYFVNIASATKKASCAHRNWFYDADQDDLLVYADGGISAKTPGVHTLRFDGSGGLSWKTYDAGSTFELYKRRRP